MSGGSAMEPPNLLGHTECYAYIMRVRKSVRKEISISRQQNMRQQLISEDANIQQYILHRQQFAL